MGVITYLYFAKKREVLLAVDSHVSSIIKFYNTVITWLSVGKQLKFFLLRKVTKKISFEGKIILGVIHPDHKKIEDCSTRWHNEICATLCRHRCKCLPKCKKKWNPNKTEVVVGLWNTIWNHHT